MKKQRTVSLFLSLALLCPVLFLPAFSEKGKCSLCASFREMGFPSSYVESLCALSLEHTNWEFTPLPITRLSEGKGEKYTFSYVLEQECKKGRSLVSSSAKFLPYQGDKSVLYDAGFYDANKEAVAYFLDPRNFLTEKGVFQFLVLSGEGEFSVDAIEEILSKSAAEAFFAGTKTHLPTYLLELGKKWNLNPYHLAARLCQEQGREGNPLLWGTAGDYLKEEGKNGYYNPFNISASGKGEREIYRSGAVYAQKNGWDSPEKALEGGVKKIATEYVDTFQNTLYLQKWNVDPRSENEKGSRNFWAQFMQNIGGAKTEGEMLAKALCDNKEKMTFLIPFYENMPSDPCPDPAKGTCLVFAAEQEPLSAHAILSQEKKTAKEKEFQNDSPFLKKEDFSVKREFFAVPMVLALCALGILLIEKKSFGNRRSTGDG